MTLVPADDPLALAATQAVQRGDLAALRTLLDDHPWLADVRIGTEGPDGMSRTLLHAATDWPGHYPDVAATIGLLVARGADVGARFHGPHEETPLHWAASTDDVAALDALLDAGADIDAPGSVLGGGPPLADACGFKQWAVAARLVDRGATTTLWNVAALGLDDRVEEYLVAGAPPDDVTGAFWIACHGGRLRSAQMLLAAGAERDWIPPWEPVTPLDAAERDEAHELVAWLRAQGARSAR